MKKIAITGGLSSGKSTACQFFKELGAFVISADEIVHRLLSSHPSIKNQIIDRFGKELLEEGMISRNKLAALVFSDLKKLRELEEILHPLVFDEIASDMRLAEKRNASLCVVEVPLLYELKKEGEFDCIISVYTQDSIAKDRFQRKRSQTIDEFEKRMSRQIPIEHKNKTANYTICNDGTVDELKKQVEILYSQLLISP